MILPVGHDRARLRRRPVVTLGIAVACTLTFLATVGLGDPVQDRFERQLEEAYTFWEAHPYLEPPARLVQTYGDPGAQARAEFQAAWDAQGIPPVPRVELEMDQEELEHRVAVAEAGLRRHVWYRLGLVPAAPRPAAALGHLFLHGGWAHLIGNLLFLLLSGPFIEDRWGRAGFLAFYLASGLVGAALFAVQHPGFDGPLIGASGAIAGAMGAFAVRFGRARIRFVYWLGLFFGSFRAPAWLMLALWFGGELGHAALAEGAGAGGTAYWAHVGGFGFGVAVALAARASGLEARLGPTADEQAAREAGRVEAARAALAEGRAADAVALLEPGVGEPPPEESEDARAREALLADAAQAAGLADALRERLTGALGTAVRRGRRSEAFAALRAGRALGGPGPLGVREARRLAGWRTEAGDRAGAQEVWRAALDGAEGPAALALARAARGAAPVVALRAAERAARDPALDAAARAQALDLAREARAAAEALGIVVLPAPDDAAPASAGAAAPTPLAPDPAPVAASAPAGLASGDGGLAGPPADGGLGELPSDGGLAGLPSDAARADVLDALVRELALEEAEADAPRKAAAREARGAPEEEAKPQAPAAPTRLRALRVVEALPHALDADGLQLEVAGRGRSRLAWERVHGVAWSGVRGLGRAGRAVAVVDLLLDPPDVDGTLRVVRLRSDRFDPRALARAPDLAPLEALRRLVAAIARRARAPRIPADPDTLRLFADLDARARDLLGAQEPRPGA